MHVIRARTLLQRFDAPPIDDAGMVIHDGLIVDVGPFARIRRTYVGPDIDVDGMIIPGMVDAHSHLRGMSLAHHGIESMPLEPWLCALTTMTSLPAADEALIAAGGLLRTGVTSVQAMIHSFDDAEKLEELVLGVAGSVSAAGIRSLLILGFADQAEYGPLPRPDELSALPYAEHQIDAADYPAVVEAVSLALARAGHDLVRLGVGPVGPQWCSDRALEAIARVSTDRPVHAHLHESPQQRGWIQGAAAPLDRLSSLGLLRPGTSAAHGVDLTPRELRELAASGTGLIHCPTSNSRLRGGSAQVKDWLDAGVGASLGLDSQDSDRPDMFAEMRAAIEVSRHVGRELTASDVFAMATVGGARALGDRRLGKLVTGSAADAVELTVPVRAGSEIDDLVAAGSAAAVRTVWVGGKQVVQSGRAQSDLAELLARERLIGLLDADRVRRAERQRQIQPALDQAYALVGETR